MSNKEAVIGLFGTCGGSKWRDSFMAAYEERGIKFFNPQVEDWTPECAAIEAEHLVKDDVILFPVTDETFGNGSLAEIGFAIMQIQNTNRSLVIMVAPTASESLQESDPVGYKDNLRVRKLVRAHLTEVKLNNVYVVDDFDTMLQVSINLV
jgi:hypothetical protein